MDELPRLWGLPEVAEHLEIPYGRLYRLIRTHRLPDAAYLIGNRRIFTDTDVDALWCGLRVIEMGQGRFYPDRRQQGAA